MSITPSHISVGGLLERQYIFRVPKYQRSYAWENPQISDFINDISKCYMERLNNVPMHHFFGGVVCILEKIPGSSRQQQELVDGQQRISSFILLVANIINIYTSLSNDPTVKADPLLKDLIDSRILRLKEKYLIYRDEINRKPTLVDRITMSKSDHYFFKSLIDGSNPTETTESHRRLKNSFNKIGHALNAIINKIPSINDKADSLKIFEDVINEDCTVIHIETTTKTEAYRLFQVLNDRGINLTNGDLLRSRTLELLDNVEFELIQNDVESSWDYILKDSAKITEEFFKSYYASCNGVRPGSNTMFDDLLEKFFPQHKKLSVVLSDAEEIKKTINQIKAEYDNYKTIIEGRWLYPIAQPIAQWDCERLRILIVELDHSLCIPLLLSASSLDHKKFAKLTQLLELFIFRYKYICNNHVGSLGKVYLEEAIEIRKDPINYNIENLRKKLKLLQESNAQDDKFRALLKDIKYQTRASNKLLKYFLITTEYYLQWYINGANGVPVCLDKSRIFDFSNTTIEHIYSQNVNGSDSDLKMEEIKNTLGNLTILDPYTNSNLGNISYSNKVTYFGSSSVLMNREIKANYQTWNSNTINSRTELLLDMACKMFTAL